MKIKKWFRLMDIYGLFLVIISFGWSGFLALLMYFQAENKYHVCYYLFLICICSTMGLTVMYVILSDLARKINSEKRMEEMDEDSKQINN